MKRQLYTLRESIVALFLVLGAIVGFAFVFAGKSGDVTVVLYLACLFFLFFVVLGWLFGSLLARWLHEIGHDVRTMQTFSESKTLSSCDVRRVHFKELGQLCDVISEVAEAITTTEQRLTKRMEKKTTELEAAKRLLHNFIFYLAHTLRTPLNSIRWTAEVLKDEEQGALGTGQRESLDVLEHSVVSTLGIVRDLQDVLMLDQKGTLALQRVACPLPSLVDEVAGRWAVHARMKQLRFTVKHHEANPPLVFGDRERLGQAIDELIDNAIRYTPEGGQVHVETRTIVSGAQKSSLQCCVKDTGIGIPAGDQSHVFEKFFRARNAKEQWVDGTGIGLTLAKMILKAHKGRLWFTSQQGKGSLFCLQVPAMRSPQANASAHTKRS